MKRKSRLNFNLLGGHVRLITYSTLEQKKCVRALGNTWDQQFARMYTSPKRYVLFLVSSVYFPVRVLPLVFIFFLFFFYAYNNPLLLGSTTDFFCIIHVYMELLLRYFCFCRYNLRCLYLPQSCGIETRSNLKFYREVNFLIVEVWSTLYVDREAWNLHVKTR